MNLLEILPIHGLEFVCEDSVPSILGFLDPSIAPPFLYYSYIPIIFIVLLFGLTVFLASHATFGSRVFLWTAVVFSLLIGGELLLWIAAPVYVIHFVWQIIPVWHALLVYLLAHFVYTFINQRPLPALQHWGVVALLAPILLLTPTTLNLSGFDIVNCESTSGLLWVYIYAIEALTALAILVYCVRIFVRKTARPDRFVILLLGCGVSLFWVVFIASNALGDLTLFHDINLLGPLGMVALLATLSYLIVRYHAFNLKVFGAQALIIALFALLFAALFVRQIEHARIVLSGTLILVGVLGALLIRSVKREVTLREELEIANKQQENLLHFISHEVKGYLTESEAGFASIAEGDYAETPPKLVEMAKSGLANVRRGVRTVMEILDASNLKKGTVSYKKQSFDLKETIRRMTDHLKRIADEKHLTINVSIGDGNYMMEGDEEKVKQHVVRNLIDNAIKYTPKGTIEIRLTDGDKLRFSVKDSGVGITPEDMKNLFTEGGHGKDSIKVNVHSTGYGLFIAKQIVEGHGGKIWAESAGQGKGSKFIVEFPLLR